MKTIWFNPHKDQYELGSRSDFEAIKAKESKVGFEVEYELNLTNDEMAERLVRALNESNSKRLSSC